MSDLNYGRCSKCGNHGFLSSHKCPPTWQIGNYKDELEPTYGDTLLDAAERYVERDQWSSVEFEPETTVYGIDADGQLVEIIVTMEAVPTYNAELKRA
jgi:hypothetical protein